MDFGLSQEQELLQETLRRFLADRCPTTRVREVMESDSGHDAALWSALAELGLAAICIPEALGGIGSELLDLAIVSEEMGYAAAPGPFLGNAMATIGLVEGQSEQTRSRWLPKMAAGQVIGTVAIGEAGSEWRPEHLATRAQGGCITGEKLLVPYADTADILLVGACDDDGPGVWLVEGGADGIAASELAVNDMTRRLHHVAFSDTPALKIGGAALLERIIDAGSILVAADAFGGSSRCVDMARDYVMQREQFGQVIGAFQAVKHQLADLVADLEPSMSLYWYAAHAFDHLGDQSSRCAAMAKAHATDLFDRVAGQTTELHGGIGFTWEFDLHLWFRRALFDRSFLGEASLHRERAALLARW